MADDIAERVRWLVADQVGVRKDRLTDATDVFLGLGVDGIDAFDLLQRFGKEFDVSLDAVECDRHFGPEEAFNPFLWLWPKWRASHRVWRSNLIPVTIADLVEAAKTRKWTFKYEDPLV